MPFTDVKRIRPRPLLGCIALLPDGEGPRPPVAIPSSTGAQGRPGAPLQGLMRARDMLAGTPALPTDTYDGRAKIRPYGIARSPVVEPYSTVKSVPPCGPAHLTKSVIRLSIWQLKSGGTND